jgi:hypothetical protein
MPKKKPPSRRRQGGPEGIYDRAMKTLAAKEVGGKAVEAEVPEPSSSSEDDEGNDGARKCEGDVLAGALEEGGAGGAGAPKRMRKKLKRLSVGVTQPRACMHASLPTLPLVRRTECDVCVCCVCGGGRLTSPCASTR